MQHIVGRAIQTGILPSARGDTHMCCTWFVGLCFGLVANSSRSHMQGRNPYALAHFANHPEQGEQPNVMFAPVDLGEKGKLRMSSSTNHQHVELYRPCTCWLARN